VAALDRLFGCACAPVTAGLGGGEWSSTGTGAECFFCLPNEKVRSAAFRNPPEEDFGIGGTGMSTGGFLCVFRQSSWPPVSADDGAVEALLCREELSVEVVFVVFEEPLPLLVG
jgi:hypothetical protein